MNLGFGLGVPFLSGRLDLYQRFYKATLKLGEQAERTH